MTRPFLAACLLLLPLTSAACSTTEAPRANKALRPVPLTSTTDLEAYDIADAVDDQLRAWCKAAVLLREEREELAAEDPIVDGRAANEVARLRAAAEAAASSELAAALETFADAHEERLAALVAGRKFAVRRYRRADRKVAELGFGLRRWRMQR